jgi:hypothetical protein
MTKTVHLYFTLRKTIPSYPPGLCWALAVLRTRHARL